MKDIFKPIDLPELDLVYKDTFSMEFLYKGIHDWLEEEGYVNSPNGVDEKWIETMYVERVAGDGKKEHWIWWRTNKKISKTFKFILNIDFHTLALGKKEVMHEGQKISLDSGEVEIWIKPVLLFDYEKELRNTFFFKSEWFSHYFKKRMYKKDVEEKEDLLKKDSRRLQDYIRQYFELKVYMSEYAGEPFKPAKGKGL